MQFSLSAHRRAAGVALFGAAVPLLASPSIAAVAPVDPPRYERVDLPLPPERSSAFPISSTESGDVLALAWSGSEPMELWLWLRDAAFEAPSGWVSLGVPTGFPSGFVGAVASPDSGLVGAAGAATAELPFRVLPTRVARPMQKPIEIERADIAFDIRAVSDDGFAVGMTIPAAGDTPAAGWFTPTASGFFALPSPDCVSVRPVSSTTGQRAVGMARVPAAQGGSRAVLLEPAGSHYLDELAPGVFPWAAGIRRDGTIVAARTTESGDIRICELVDLQQGSHGGLSPDTVGSTQPSSGNSSASTSGSGGSGGGIAPPSGSLRDRLPQSAGARAVQLVMGLRQLVPTDRLPGAIEGIAAQHLAYLTESRIKAGTVGHTQECVAHVHSENPACIVDWDALCEEIAGDYYESVVIASGIVSSACRQIVCTVDPACCDAEWDSHCAHEVALHCTDMAPGTGCPFRDPWPPTPDHCYCGASGGFPFESVCFNECCAQHDMCYATCGAWGGDPNELDPFASCQWGFLRCMQAKCTSGATPSWCGSYKNCTAKSVAYVLAVVGFSKTAWCECCASVTPARCEGVAPPPPVGGGGAGGGDTGGGEGSGGGFWESILDWFS